MDFEYNRLMRLRKELPLLFVECMRMAIREEAITYPQAEEVMRVIVDLVNGEKRRLNLCLFKEPSDSLNFKLTNAKRCHSELEFLMALYSRTIIRERPIDFNIRNALYKQ